MNEKKNRRRALERVSELLEIPGEALAGQPRLTITGNRRVYIEGHKGVLEYGAERISVNIGSAVLRIRGEGLEIISMNAEELLITGNISGLEYD